MNRPKRKFALICGNTFVKLKRIGNNVRITTKTFADRDNTPICSWTYLMNDVEVIYLYNLCTSVMNGIIKNQHRLYDVPDHLKPILNKKISIEKNDDVYYHISFKNGNTTGMYLTLPVYKIPDLMGALMIVHMINGED